MNIKTLRHAALAGFAAIAITAAGAVATPTEARANDAAIAGFIGGLIVGGVVASAHPYGTPVYGRPVYAAPAYGAPRYYYGPRYERRHHRRYGQDHRRSPGYWNR